MTDLLQSILFVLVVAIVVVVLPLMWLRRNRRARQMKDAQQAAAFEQRQLHPNYAAFKSRHGCEPPPPLRQLYEDRATVLAAHFDVRLPSSRVRYSVGWFEPMDEAEWPDMDGFYAFANDGCGNSYLIDPRQADPAVLLLDHETDKRESVGVPLSEFLSAMRTK